MEEVSDDEMAKDDPGNVIRDGMNQVVESLGCLKQKAELALVAEEQRAKRLKLSAAGPSGAVAPTASMAPFAQADRVSA